MRCEVSVGDPSDDTLLATVTVRVEYGDGESAFNHEFSVPLVLLSTERLASGDVGKDPAVLELVSAVVQSAPR